MRNHPARSRVGRAAIALLGGLLVGGWVGGGLVWILNRNKYKDPNTVADVALAKAEEVEMVPADAMGFVHLRLADLWKTESAAELRKLVEKAGPDALKALDDGFVPAPSSVDRATIVVIKGAPSRRPVFDTPFVAPQPKGIGAKKGGAGVPPPPPPPPPPPKGVVAPAPKESLSEPTVFAILSFSAPFDADKVRLANMPTAIEEVAGEKTFWFDHNSDLAVYFPSNQVMVIGTGSGLDAFLRRPAAKDGPLAPAIKLAASGQRHLIAAANIGQVPTDKLPIGIPTELRPILRAESLTLGAVVGNGAKVDVRASYKDDAAAADAEKALRAAAEEGRNKIAEMKKDMEASLKGKGDGKSPRPFKQLPEAVGGLVGIGAMNSLDEWLADPPLKREGNEVAVTATLNSLGSAYAGVLALSIGTMIPAIDKVRDAAARTADSNNLRELGLAMQMYHDAMGKFPATSWSSKPGQTGLSWRVALLPYIEQGALYNQFKHDEPWDSENNKKLIPLMPKLFASPQAAAEPGKTYYKVFVGGGAIFDRDPSKIRRLATIPDGTSNTILIAEGGDPVIWTKPDDFEFDPKKPLPNIWLPNKPGINVVLADGAVRFINRSMSEQTLKLAIQADDGQPLGKDW